MLWQNETPCAMKAPHIVFLVCIYRQTDGRCQTYYTRHVRYVGCNNLGINGDFAFWKGEACKVCGARESPESGVKLARCAKCRGVMYCGKDCQLKDWKESHKYQCAGEKITLIIETYLSVSYLLFTSSLSIRDTRGGGATVRIVKYWSIELPSTDQWFVGFVGCTQSDICCHILSCFCILLASDCNLWILKQPI